MLFEGCANSGPGRLGVPEMTWTDGPGFSLCTVLLESSDPVFRSDAIRTTEEERKSRVFQTGESQGKLSEQEETKLSQKLSWY